MDNIIQRIDDFLKEYENAPKSKSRYIEKEDAIQVIECIMKSVPDDKVLLETIKSYIDNEWSITNHELIERFYKLMNFYGIIEEDTSFRKTVLEAKGKTVVRKFVNIEEKEQIANILK